MNIEPSKPLSRAAKMSRDWEQGTCKAHVVLRGRGSSLKSRHTLWVDERIGLHAFGLGSRRVVGPFGRESYASGLG